MGVCEWLLQLVCVHDTNVDDDGGGIRVMVLNSTASIYCLNLIARVPYKIN